MAELITKQNGTCDLKFHATVKKFKRVEKFNYKKNFFKIYIDKNDSVYDITTCEVVSWKTVEKGRKKITVPDTISEVRELNLINKLRGVPSKLAINRIAAEIDVLTL